MRSRYIIIGGIGAQNPAQVRFAQYDEMVETFPSDRPDQSFRKTVSPRRAASDGFVTDAHSSHATCNHRAVDTIPITDQIAWSRVPRECLADLASNPLGSGICGDGNPDQAPAGQSNNDKAIEQIKANGRSNEQIHGRDVRRVVAQEGAVPVANLIRLAGGNESAESSARC